MKSETKTKKSSKLLILATMLFILFLAGAMFFYFSSAVDASAAVRGDIILPPDPFITPSEIPTAPTEPTEPTKPTEPTSIDRFKDIDKTGWYVDGIKYALGHGLMNGVDTDKFEPNGNVTRAMLVTVLYRLADKPSVSGATIPFTDVKRGDWYYDAVVWAYDKGIGNGTSETTFAPNAPVTREQLVTFLWRYVGQPASAQSLDAFPDNATVSSYAHTALQWAVEKSIINGNGGNLEPLGYATRAQIAVIFMRSEKVLA